MQRTLALALLAMLAACRDATSVTPPGTALPAVAPPSGVALPDPLQAIGTEPFWAVTLVGGRLTYRTPDDQAGSSITVRRRSAGEGDAVVVGRLAGAALRMRITPGPCSDGMSDTVYPYTVELTIGGERRLGCARPGGRAG